MIHEFEPDHFHVTIGSHEPVLRLASGDTIRTWTVDSGGYDKTGEQITDGGNPQTGPFFIEGAEPGDTLAVHFVSIEPREAWGVSANVPFFGSLTATPTTAMLHPALAERTWYYELDLDDRLVRYAAVDSTFTAPFDDGLIA